MYGDDQNRFSKPLALWLAILGWLASGAGVGSLALMIVHVLTGPVSPVTTLNAASIIASQVAIIASFAPKMVYHKNID